MEENGHKVYYMIVLIYPLLFIVLLGKMYPFDVLNQISLGTYRKSFTLSDGRDTCIGTRDVVYTHCSFFSVSSQ
jgi:hypothetical protein